MNQPYYAIRIPMFAALALAAGLTACSRQNEDNMNAPRTNAPVAEVKQESNTVAAASDMTITAKVNAALAVDDQLKATQINVDTRDGQVTLSGQAPSAQSRERATTLAAAVDGVKQVKNQLVVGQNG